MNMDVQIELLQKMIEQEREPLAEKTLAAIQAHRTRRAQMIEDFQMLAQVMHRLQHEIKSLPALPDTREVQWARAVLSLENLFILEIDTTGLDTSDEITRVVLVDRTGKVSEDVLVNPSPRSISPDASRASGITNEDVAQASTITQWWPSLDEVLSGVVVVSFMQDFDIRKIREVAERHSLPPITFIGLDLTQPARSYFQSQHGSVASLAQMIGQPLPERATGVDRAIAQYRLLQAMADMWTKPEDDLGDLDEHPF